MGTLDIHNAVPARNSRLRGCRPMKFRPQTPLGRVLRIPYPLNTLRCNILIILILITRKRVIKMNKEAIKALYNFCVDKLNSKPIKNRERYRLCNLYYRNCCTDKRVNYTRWVSEARLDSKRVWRRLGQRQENEGRLYLFRQSSG